MNDFLNKLFDALGSDKMFYFICVYVLLLILFNILR